MTIMNSFFRIFFRTSLNFFQSCQFNQSIYFIKSGLKMRSPFYLLEDDNKQLSLEPKFIQRQRDEQKKEKKVSSMPFAKYEIIHPIESSKLHATRTIKEAKQKQQSVSNQPIKPGSEATSNQMKQKISDQSSQINQKDSQQQRLLPELPIRASSLNQTQNNSNDEDQQKQYFLKKKNRQISYKLNADGDPPILYDIGLDVEMIKDKMKLVIKMGQPDYDIIMNPDLAGPVLIAFTFGFLLLFSGQIHFGDIYALFIIGNLVMFILFNFMARKEVISLYNIMSILGYCLIPMLTLGIGRIFINLNNFFGLIFGLIISLWSSVAGGNFIQVLLRGNKNRKVLIIYPLFLFYANFAMIVIF